MRTVLITGGLGFIGGNFVQAYREKNPKDQIIILDAMTYAAHPELVKKEYERTLFWDLSKPSVISQLRDLIDVQGIDHIYHFAAETHVCRSIETPVKFFYSNLCGTVHLLEAARQAWVKSHKDKLFFYISTDEVFGELEIESPHKFTPNSIIAPRSPYAASKAAGQMAVRSYAETYGLPTMISCCSNNFGPYQHEEKLVPKTILHLKNKKPVEIYGAGNHVRDWLPVSTHCDAILHLSQHGIINRQKPYLIGGNMELTNIEIAFKIFKIMESKYKDIRWNLVHDFSARPHDDKRYAIDTSDLESTGFEINPQTFTDDLDQTIRWYCER